ncbi:WASH complex subunit 2A [Zerene cesonia]|uniref:WASH complex subunit 2A n=1 Tax=Zerene cesonia TaxID=33412 RepID=UPI0018E54E98|nr:WASH complex subunit 2A [Zerene cesonia]
MEKVDTETLRSAASKWSLGGDRHLLNLLQNIHQKIMTKCTETNAKMDELVDTLETASVDLQNVNNKFMALSNNQFVESRVYDDDIDVQTASATPKEPQTQTDPGDEVAMMKQSLLVIESMHEQVQILDSDSSDDDDDGRLILKPKDMYHHRPLPYVIGSQMWRKKWHAGLMVEDSDTDSAGSKPPPGEVYSDSEPELTDTQTDKQIRDVTVTSSNTSAEVSTNAQTKPDVPRPCRPADVAAELARRLGGEVRPIDNILQIPPPPSIPVDLPPATGKVYRPAQPATATIFSNEPPPLDQCASEDEESEDDIFAELHKNRYTPNDRVANNNVVDALFGDSPNVIEKVTSNSTNKRPVFDDESEPELFVEKPKEIIPEPREEAFKKPVGGISLFGSNKDSNSIGAAILKRNQRKSSSSEEDAPETQPEPKLVPNKSIIEDLFVKPKVKKPVAIKNTNKEVKKDKEVKTEEKAKEKKVDLFSDDLFDDIDDIFTSKVITKRPENNKSIFDDDLFNDIAVSKDKPKEVKSIFDDDDDDLFSDVKVAKESVKSTTEPRLDSVQKSVDTKSNKDTVNNDDHDLFNENVLSTENVKPAIESNSISKASKPKSIFDDDSDDELFKNNTEIVNATNIKSNGTIKDNSIKADVKKNNIFDDESDDDIFHNNSLSVKPDLVTTKQNSISFNDDKVHEVIESKAGSKDNVPEANINDNYVPNDITKRRNIFDDDSEEELFSGKKKTEPENNKLLQETDANVKVDETSKNGVIISEKHVTQTSVNTATNSIKDTSIPEKREKVNDTDPINETLVSQNTESHNSLDSQNENLNINKKPTVVTSPNIFDDDEIDDMFSSNVEQSNSNKIEESRNSEVGSSINTVESDASPDTDAISSRETSSNVQDEHVSDKTPQPPVPDTSSHIESKILEEREEELSAKSNDDLHEAINPDIEYKTETNSDMFATNNKDTLQEQPPESSLFTDIFNDMPPEFEKPKEPKKSKNVNALFDDDSDDEASFFKKSDVITEDVPSPSYDANERFSIFHDEPPAIDVDFISKPVKSSKNIDIEEIPKKHFDDFNSQDIFGQNVKTEEKSDFAPGNTVGDKVETNLESNLHPVNYESNKVISESSGLEDSIRSTNAMITEKINKMHNDQNFDANVAAKQNKSIGKLKPINLNINVNTLLPGASPKKSKPIENVDNIVSSTPESSEKVTKEVKNVNFADERESAILKNELSKETAKIEVVDGIVASKSQNTEKVTKDEKTVNFEDEKESAILNNKLSKERAKIQVKRRPSTRRARKEAARKSGIDFGDSIDKTDNSDSIDEPKIRLVTDKKDATNLDANHMKVSPDKETNTQTNVRDFSNTDNKLNSDIINSPSDKNTTDTIIQRSTDTNYSKPNKNVTSKVVYILNDEDIFSDVNKNPDEAKPQNHENKSNNSLPIPTTEEASKTDKKFDSNHNPNTDKKATIFDLSDSDSELFGAKKVTVASKSKLFESDSDDDLFGGRSKREIVREEVVKPKGNLFGDESDDELFTTKVRKQDEKTSHREPTSKPSEPVFEDPLSMLTQDDE